VAPPAPPKDPFVPVTARTLARLAQRIDRSRLPENVQNLLLDRIATLLADLKHAPGDGDHRRTTVLVGIASLIKTLDSAVPAHVSRKVGDGAKEHVMDHLRSMLFAAATGRGDQLDYASQVA
jgi:hypothetical protein